MLDIGKYLFNETSGQGMLTPSLSNLWTVLSLMLVRIMAGLFTESFLHSPVPRPSGTDSAWSIGLRLRQILTSHGNSNIERLYALCFAFFGKHPVDLFSLLLCLLYLSLGSEDILLAQGYQTRSPFPWPRWDRCP